MGDAGEGTGRGDGGGTGGRIGHKGAYGKFLGAMGLFHIDIRLHMFIKTHRTVPEKRTKFTIGKSDLKKPSTPTDKVTKDNNALTIAMPSNSPLLPRLTGALFASIT